MSTREFSKLLAAAVSAAKASTLHQRKRDNWTDAAGYARCGWICDEAAKKRQAENEDTFGL